MRWTYSIKNKLAAAGVLFGLCLLVLLSNYNDRQHTKQVKEMISTLYQDRLIAEEYLFTLTHDLYKIRELSNSKVVDSKNSEVGRLLTEINETSVAYRKTKLTANEAIAFTKFEKEVAQLKSEFDSYEVISPVYSKTALTLLEDLSDLQLDESKLIVEKSEKEYKLSKLLSNFAFAIAIILLLFLQALVFSSKTLHISNRKVHPNLN